MKREFDFAAAFGEIDEKLVEEAGKEWKRGKGSVFRLYSRKIACAAAAVVLCLAMAWNSSVQAAVKAFTTKIGEAFGFTKDLSSYTELIDQTQTINGISLTLKEVIVDDRVLMVSVRTDFGQDEKGALWINQEQTMINGQKHMIYESMESAGSDINVFESERDSVLALVYEEQILPEGEVTVHLVLEAQKMINTGDAYVMEPNESFIGDAEFVYDFVVTPEELKAKTVRQELDITVAASGADRKDLTFRELTMNDLYCKITAEGLTWDAPWPNQYELKLKGTDSLGNPVSLDGGRFLNETEMLFVTDFFGDYEAGQVIDDKEFYLSVPDKDCEYLDLQLYERKIIWNGEETIDEDDEYASQVLTEGAETYAGEENYGWKPVGEPIRIVIEH